MADIGSTLREARMRARIDITEVETATKIRAKYLRAIENEEWDLLPGPIYVKSFLRTYGDYLGLDSRLLIDEYKRRYERPSDHDLRPIASLRRERERRERGPRGPILSPRIIVGLVLVAVVAALYLIGRGSSNPSKPAPAPTASTHRTTPRKTHPGVATIFQTTPRRIRPKSVRLQLVPTGTIYICVEDPAGKPLIPGVIYQSGQTVPVEHASRLLVTLGNNAVQMTVNGKATPVPASASAISLKVAPGGVSPLPAAQAPTCQGG